MLYVPNENNDPRVNLAIETFLLKKFKQMNLFYYFILTNLLLLLGETKIL